MNVADGRRHVVSLCAYLRSVINSYETKERKKKNLTQNGALRVGLWVVSPGKGVGTARATGALAPAMLKPRGRKCLFAPAIIYEPSDNNWSEWLPGLILLLHQNSWLPGLRPGPHWGAYSAPQTSSWWRGGLPPLTQEPLPLAQPFGLRASSFGPSGFASPRQCWFRSDASVSWKNILGENWSDIVWA